LPAIEDNDFDIRIHAAQEVLIVRHRRIDNDDLRPGFVRHEGRNGLEQVLTVCRLLGLSFGSTVGRDCYLGLFLRDLLLIHFGRSGRGGGVEHETGFKGKER
jgi:hypothetical protein